ncbi:MAG: hypothetical protein LBK99_13000 [Opitutaceae bacterium]|jgi:hypothetical protein|nr:hypothetical protein [Opitutaceae bacterium]
MGWLFSHQTQAALIHELIQSEENERFNIQVIAHQLCDDVLWSVAEITVKAEGVFRNLAPGQSFRIIRRDLLQGYGDHWGYKPMDESMHPYCYTCPLCYLEMAPERSRKWREGVRAYHAGRRLPASPVRPVPAHRHSVSG